MDALFNELSKLDICVDLRFAWGETVDEGEIGDKLVSELGFELVAEEDSVIGFSLLVDIVVIVQLVELVGFSSVVGMFWIVFVIELLFSTTVEFMLSVDK